MKSYSQLAENNKLIGRAAICITFLFPLRKSQGNSYNSQ